jgi:hypothetical protein
LILVTIMALRSATMPGQPHAEQLRATRPPTDIRELLAR